MAILSDSLRLSNLNLTGISNSLSSSQKTISTANSTVERLSRNIQSNTRIKKELIDRSSIIRSRRDEASRRQELEDQLESSKVSTDTRKGLSFASKSELNPFGRLLGFLGFITAGWIMDNLPTWIFMGTEFIDRARRLGSYLPNMLSNLISISQSFTSVLSNSLTSILRLDFDEFSEGSVAKSFEGLQLSIEDLGTNITDTFKLFTTPLTQSLETGEQAPDLGEMREDTTQPQYPTSTQEMRTVTGIHKQALDIIAGPESGGNYNAMNQGTDKNGNIIGSTTGGKTSKDIIGKYLTDMTIGEIMDRQNERKYPRNAKPDLGIHAAGKYQIIGMTLPTAMKNAGLKPSDKFSPENQDKLGLAVLKSQGIGAWTSGGTRYNAKETAIIKQAQRTPVTYTSSTSQPILSTTQSSSPAQVQSAPMVVTSGFGWRWGRKHLGIDLAPKTGKVEGTPVIIKKGGTVVYANIGGRNMGQVLITHDDGTQSRYLHVNNFRVKAGQKVNAGQTIAYLAAMGAPGIGNAKAPHLHFEYYPSSSAPPTDPAGVYQNYVSLGGKVINSPPKPLDPNQQPRIPEVAQISAPPKPSQPAQITPERRGSQVTIIDDSQPVQQPQVPYVSQQPTVTPTVHESKLLNNFIKNKLLLDLAYL